MPQALAPLDSLLINGVHRFATCWKIERTDGVSLHLTNHNTVLVVEGVSYSPVGSPSQTAVETKEGTASNNFAATSYITTAAVSEADLTAGRYRGSTLTEFLVDWKYPWMGKFRLTSNRILETSFTGEVWEMQIEDIKSKLKQRVGRVYSRNCDYIFGDPTTCKFNRAALVQSNTVATVASRRAFAVSVLAAASGYFDDGTLSWTSGANSGLACEIKSQVGTAFEFHVSAPFTIAPGDAFDVLPGCRHTKTDCIAFQGSLVNFGGFPTIPGSDKLIQTPDAR